MLRIWLLKLAASLSRFLRLGAGSTWPGHILLAINPSFLKEFDKKFTGKIIVIAGTNGKTTTSKMVQTILEKSGKTVIHNSSGANLLNGVASSIIDRIGWDGKLPQIAVFDVDENTLPLLLEQITPDTIVLLNLFRDQLDRYGEVDAIAQKWKKALTKLSKTTSLVLNADDPHIAFLGKDLTCKVSYFGMDNKTPYLAVRQHAMDAVHCPNCGKRLVFEGVYFAHLGKWECSTCGFKRHVFAFLQTTSALPGMYNMYNTQAAITVAKQLKIPKKVIEMGLKHFVPAFGRQETVKVGNKRMRLFLSKNPTGFNESIRVIKELGGKYFLLVLNDRIPDGRDISWIWDIDTEEIIGEGMHITVAGERVYDMALRIKYSGGANLRVEEDLRTAMRKALDEVPEEGTLYILPTYSAM